MVHFVGLDVPVKKTSVCIVDDAGKVISELKVPTETADIIALLSSLGPTFGRNGIYDGGVSKCGDALLRTMLYEAARSLLTHSGKWSWLKAWGMRVAQRRGIRRAIVAVVRRLAVILHRMWVDGSEFRWKKDSAAVLALKSTGGKRRNIAGKQIMRSAPAEECPHGER